MTTTTARGWGEPWERSGATVYQLNEHGFNRYHFHVYSQGDDAAPPEFVASQIMASLEATRGIPDPAAALAEAREAIKQVLVSVEFAERAGLVMPSGEPVTQLGFDGKPLTEIIRTALARLEAGK